MKPDIQICNHNYLLADASHRLEDRPLLLRSYQALVVDEAHKLPDAARQMYTETLSSRAMDELCLLLQQAHYKDFARQLRTAFLTLSFSCTQGFSKLRRKVSEPFVLTPFRRAALIDCIALLQNAGGLPDVPRYLLNRLGEAESLLRLFLLEVPTRILYIDYDADAQPTFCAASSRVPQLLRSALWNAREPAILTSGTLAAAGDFSHTEQLLGLAAYRPLRHFRADSPFNYKKKCLLYFPPRTRTRMDNRRMAEEIVRLVDACHGHALVLFTAYRQMAEVRALDGRSVDISDLIRRGATAAKSSSSSSTGQRCCLPPVPAGGIDFPRRYGVPADYRCCRSRYRTRSAITNAINTRTCATTQTPKCPRSTKLQLVWPCHPYRAGFLRGGNSGRARGHQRQITMTPRWQLCRLPNHEDRRCSANSSGSKRRIFL